MKQKKFYKIDILGDNILLKDHEGIHKIKYQPSLYFRDSKNPTFTSFIDNVPLTRIKSDTIRSHRSNLKEARELYPEQVFGHKDITTNFIAEYYSDDQQIDFQDLKIFYLDIETYVYDGFPDSRNPINEITAITVMYNEQTFTWALTNKKGERAYVDTPFRQYDDEKELLTDFVKFWSVTMPDIITGWNVKLFDMPYLSSRINLILGEKELKKLSPFRYYRTDTVNLYNRDNPVIEFYGVSILDYQDLYEKFLQQPRENSKLDYIAHVELGEKKLDYSEHENLNALYEEDFQKFIEYNIKDVDLVRRLNDKLRYLELTVDITTTARTNFTEIFSPIKMWETFIFSTIYKDNIVTKINFHFRKKENYDGGYVFDPQIGRFGWSLLFDWASLYPNIIRSFNIGPETLVHYQDLPDKLKKIYGHKIVEDFITDEFDSEIMSVLQENNLGMTGNGMFFKQDKQSVMAKLITGLYKQRVADKKESIKYTKKLEELEKGTEEYKKIYNLKNMYFASEQAKKILLNSLYGALGSERFFLFDKNLAEATTVTGQLINRFIAGKIDNALNSALGEGDYILLGDTDSLLFDVQPLVDKKLKGADDKTITDTLDHFAAGPLQNIINKNLKHLFDTVNPFERTLVFEREIISDRIIICAKKHYAMNIVDKEGLRFPKPYKKKIMGLEIIKSTTPQLCREEIATYMDMMMYDETSENLYNRLIAFEQRFKAERIENLAPSKKVNMIKKYSDNGNCVKGTPRQSRAAINFNTYLKKLGIKNVEPIYEGEKIKIISLKEPNPLGDVVIGFKTFMPKEFGLEKYYDYDRLYDTSVKDPIKSLIKAMNWSIEDRNTLDDLL